MCLARAQGQHGRGPTRAGDGAGAQAMRTVTQATLRHPGLLAVREAHFARLEALYSGEVLDAPFRLCGIVAHSDADPAAEPDRWLDEALDSLACQAHHASDPSVFRPLCLQYDPYGVHFIDSIFGADTYQSCGQMWSDPLGTPIGELQPPDLRASPPWELVRGVAEAFVAQRVALPLFGLPTISSALNIAVNLHRGDFLASMVSQPEAAARDLRVINELLCELHRWYLQHLPREQLQPVVPAGRSQPRGFGQLCGCTTHLLSMEVYRGLVAPLDDALLSVYPRGGMIHLCGAHTQHIPVWRKMRSLRAVQINDRAAEDFEVYFRRLRCDQVIYLNPTGTMTAERALAISGGRRTVVVGDPPEG